MGKGEMKATGRMKNTNKNYMLDVVERHFGLIFSRIRKAENGADVV